MTYTREQLLEAADVLDKAHDVILERGWWPGTERAGLFGGRCMEAAVVEVVDATRLRKIGPHATTLAAIAYERPDLYLLLTDRGIDFCWNDAIGRTEDEVFDRLRSVAKQLREEASP